MVLVLYFCVSKKYTMIWKQYADLKKETRSVADENAALLQAKNQLELDRDALKTELKVKSERKSLSGCFKR
jgi:chemotaxis protein MotB